MDLSQCSYIILRDGFCKSSHTIHCMVNIDTIKYQLSNNLLGIPSLITPLVSTILSLDDKNTIIHVVTDVGPIGVPAAITVTYRITIKLHNSKLIASFCMKVILCVYSYRLTSAYRIV